MGLAFGTVFLCLFGSANLASAASAASAASVETLAYGAIAIRDANNRLVPGVEVLIRKGACQTGAPVWQSKTANRSDAYGAFAFSLSPGPHCAETITVPQGFVKAAPEEFVIGSGRPAWKTTWIHGGAPTSHIGVVAARNAYSQPIPGVRIRITKESCAVNGPAVWDAATPARPDAYGAFAFTLPAGKYCLLTISVPTPYSLAESADLTLSVHTAVASVNLWLPKPTSAPATDDAQRMLELTNETRAAAGRGPLEYSTMLSAVAQRWSDHMATTGTFAHNPHYSSQIPPSWQRAAENVALRQPANIDQLHQQFVNSSGHYQNMIGDFTTVGFGYSVLPDGRGYVTVNFGKYVTNPA